jgi:hypothetical protein
MTSVYPLFVVLSCPLVYDKRTRQNNEKGINRSHKPEERKYNEQEIPKR